MSTELNDWKSFMAATGASTATIRGRLETLGNLSRHAGTPVLDLGRKDVIAFLGRTTIKPWSRITYWRSIKAWDVWALEFGYITESIIRGIPAPKTPAPVARPITDDSINDILATRLSPRARAYVLLGLYAGLRIHEIARIRGEHFDHAAGWLTVQGKGGNTAVIPIHPEISKLAATMPEIGYWFPGHLDPAKHVYPKAVGNTVRNAMIQAGVDATAHRLRDTAATRIQREGHDLRVTQAFLRHSSVATTMKYTKVSDTDLQAATVHLKWGEAA